MRCPNCKAEMVEDVKDYRCRECGCKLKKCVYFEGGRPVHANLHPKSGNSKWTMLEPYIPLTISLSIIILLIIVLGMMAVVDNMAYHLGGI